MPKARRDVATLSDKEVIRRIVTAFVYATAIPKNLPVGSIDLLEPVADDNGEYTKWRLHLIDGRTFTAVITRDEKGN